MCAADSQRFTIPQLDLMTPLVTLTRWADFEDRVDVDDEAAMDAYELARIESLLQRSHGVPCQVGPSGHVQADVVVGGLDPVDLPGEEELHSSPRTEHDSTRRYRATIGLRQNRASRVATGRNRKPSACLSLQGDSFVHRCSYGVTAARDTDRMDMASPTAPRRHDGSDRWVANLGLCPPRCPRPDASVGTPPVGFDPSQGALNPARRALSVVFAL